VLMLDFMWVNFATSGSYEAISLWSPVGIKHMIALHCDEMTNKTLFIV